MKTLQRTIFPACFIVLCLACPAFAAEPISFDESLSFRNITGRIEYCEDAKKTLTISDVSGGVPLKWKQPKRDNINFGYTRSAYWFRFTVDNEADKVLRWLLELDFPTLDLIELYLPDGHGGYRVKRTGDTLPFDTREMKYINFIFRIDQKPGPMQCYIRITSDHSLNFNLNMLSTDYFIDRLYTDMPIYWLFFGLMVVMALYYLVLFVFTRETGYLYLAGTVVFNVLFELNFKGFAAQYLWPNVPWWTQHAQSVFVSIQIFFAYMFIIEFAEYKKIHPRLHRLVIWVLMLACPGLAVLSLIVRVDVSLQIIYAFVGMLTLPVMIIGIYLAFFRKPPSRQVRILLIAFFLVMVTIPIVILTMMGVLPANFLTRWSMQLGFASALVLLSFGMADKINRMKDVIDAGESRYRHLVESTGEIIFTLDESNRIQSVNGAAKVHLGFTPEELANADFPDLIVETWHKKTNIARHVVLEYISDLKARKKGSVKFRTTIKDKYSHEPKEFAVTLEYTGGMDTDYVILGRASPVIDDVISYFLESERHEYNLNNYLSNADLISQRLVRNLYKFLDGSTISEVRIALREAIINAIEHGNLNLSFEEKSECLAAGRYFDVVKERQAAQAVAERKVHVAYSLNGDSVEYTIADEGDGFDHESAMNCDCDDADNAGLMHGRGLMMISDTFDVVRFNEKGNRIVLVKYLKKTV
ncbi:MAG: ATP-binding protein [Spirochaetes bacterium]|nr:ATP-binding protein [Spirochaetota bacterium]